MDIKAVSEEFLHQIADNLGPTIHCDRCGALMDERKCKVVCDNCGMTRDCSDP